jgi:hypothetical protein
MPISQPHELRFHGNQRFQSAHRPVLPSSVGNNANVRGPVCAPEARVEFHCLPGHMSVAGHRNRSCGSSTNTVRVNRQQMVARSTTRELPVAPHPGHCSDRPLLGIRNARPPQSANASRMGVSKVVIFPFLLFGPFMSISRKHPMNSCIRSTRPVQIEVSYAQSEHESRPKSSVVFGYGSIVRA